MGRKGRAVNEGATLASVRVEGSHRASVAIGVLSNSTIRVGVAGKGSSQRVDRVVGLVQIRGQKVGRRQVHVHGQLVSLVVDFFSSNSK